MPQWTIYGRAECSLCDALLDDLMQLLAPEDAGRVEVIDISGDSQLESKYGSRIPVLMADGEFVCAYHLDLQRVRALLS